MYLCCSLIMNRGGKKKKKLSEEGKKFLDLSELITHLLHERVQVSECGA